MHVGLRRIVSEEYTVLSSDETRMREGWLTAVISKLERRRQYEAPKVGRELALGPFLNARTVCVGHGLLLGRSVELETSVFRRDF